MPGTNTPKVTAEMIEDTIPDTDPTLNEESFSDIYEDPEIRPNPTGPSTQERLNRLEISTGQILETLQILLQRKVDEATPATQAPLKEMSEIQMLDKLAGIQAKLLKPIMDTFKNGIQVGKVLEQGHSAYEVEAEKNDFLTAQLEEVQASISAGQNGQQIDWEKIKVTIQQIITESIPRKPPA